MHLDGSVFDFEVFPSNYVVYRKDRNIHGSGCLSSRHVDDDGDSDLVQCRTAHLLTSFSFAPRPHSCRTGTRLKKGTQNWLIMQCILA